MKALIPTSAYRKDVGRVAKRGHDLAKLDIVLKSLQVGDALPPSNRAHPADEVRLARTGTHVDLFGK